MIYVIIMDIRLRYDNSKLHINKSMQDNRNKRKSIKKSSKVRRESPRIKKGSSKGVYKGKREKLGKWNREGKRARKRKKGLKEVWKEGTQIEARDEQERMTADQITEERRKREAEEKRIRESKCNIHYWNIAKEKVPRREDEVERQKNTGKIQMWKRDQSKGILEARGRKKMQTT